MGSGQSTPQAVTVQVATLPPDQQVAAVAQASPQTGPAMTVSAATIPTDPTAMQALDLTRPAQYDIPRTAWPYSVHENTSPDVTKLAPGVNLIRGGVTDQQTAEDMCNAAPDCLYYVYKPFSKTYDVYALPGKTPSDLNAFWLPEGPRSAADPPITYVKDV